MSKLSEALGQDAQREAASKAQDYAAQQLELQRQQAEQLRKQQEEAAAQQALMAKQAQEFDVQRQMQAVGEANAANARRMGATAGKAVRLGNYQNAQTYGQLAGQKFGMTQGTQGAAQSAAGLAGNTAGNFGSLAGQGTEHATNLQTGMGMRQGQAVGQGLASAGNAIAQISDETAKENIKPAHSLKETMDRLRSMKFDYKPSQGGEKGNVGVMAQDIAKTPLKNAVTKVDTPDGEKLALDAGKMATGNTALLKEMYDHFDARIRAMESGHKIKEGMKNG